MTHVRVGDSVDSIPQGCGPSLFKPDKALIGQGEVLVMRSGCRLIQAPSHTSFLGLKPLLTLLDIVTTTRVTNAGAYNKEQARPVYGAHRPVPILETLLTHSL